MTAFFFPWNRYFLCKRPNKTMSCHTNAERFLPSILLIALLVFASACADSGSGTSANAENASAETDRPQVETTEAAPPEIDAAVLQRLKTEKWTGDLDGLVQRRYIRALVLYNKTN